MSTMFTDVNEKTSEIAAQVGRTPQNWNSSVFSMIQNLSESVVVPIAGIIITLVLCYELISMLTERNNLHDGLCGIHRCPVLLSYTGNAWYKQRGGGHGAADAPGIFLCAVREKRDTTRSFRLNRSMTSSMMYACSMFALSPSTMILTTSGSRMWIVLRFPSRTW